MRNSFRFGLMLAVSLCVTPAFAQNTNSGDIRGTAADSTGAVVPGVTVTVEDVDKHVTMTFVTDNAGLYDTGSIVPDHYIITFKKDGFGVFVRGPITLQVETLSINGVLKVGAATETVQVTSDVPLLDTESGAQSTTFSEGELQDLPNFASWENFIVLMPGTSGTPTGGNSNVNPVKRRRLTAMHRSIMCWATASRCPCHRAETPRITTSIRSPRFRLLPTASRHSMRTAG